MTDKEFEICFAVRHYHTFGKILKKTGYNSFDDLQDEFAYNALDFDGMDLTDQTVITLTRQAENEYRQRFHASITCGVAFYGAITATIAIIADIIMHFL